MKYIGGRYIGKQPIQVGRSGSTILKEGDVLNTMREQEAIGRTDFEPVYEGKQEQKKSKEIKEE